MAIDFYFDFISPYAYLAVKRLPAFPFSSDVRWLPVDLRKLVRDSGNTPPATCRSKAMYMLQDLKRWAAKLDVPFHLVRPGSFDARPALARACMLESEDRIRFCTAVFDTVWSGAVDPVNDADWLPRIVDEKNLPTDWLALDVDKGNKGLERNNAAGLAAGCFGVPTFMLEGEGRPQMFWGVDRMDFLAAALER